MIEGFVKINSGLPKNVWGTKLSFLRGVENPIEVQTYRCNKCGYLESYAK